MNGPMHADDFSWSSTTHGSLVQHARSTNVCGSLLALERPVWHVFLSLCHACIPHPLL